MECSSATAMRRDPSLVHCRLDRASGFGIVLAVAKAAVPEQRTQFDEGLRNGLRVEVREPERLHPRGIDDPRVRAQRRQRVERRRGRRVTSGRQRRRDLAYSNRRGGNQRIDDRRLAHSRLADEHGVISGEPRVDRSGIAQRGQLDDGIAERRERRQALPQLRVLRQVRLVGGEHEAAALGFGGDHPAVDEFLVQAQSRRHDANDLRDVGGDQLFAEGVRAVKQARARQRRIRWRRRRPRARCRPGRRMRSAASGPSARTRSFRRPPMSRRNGGDRWRRPALPRCCLDRTAPRIWLKRAGVPPWPRR